MDALVGLEMWFDKQRCASKETPRLRTGVVGESKECELVIGVRSMVMYFLDLICKAQD